ncbi:MAG: indolepyruvate oxidoreductase subunit beta [Chloroflexi bacterium]|nr:indolepyruvate oxidoreductase subunit beta [Chloroflexota bacterium]MBU1749744.1 indolepyruvate oxidoreductase subunit beta [Chloroflexota bacterium]
MDKVDFLVIGVGGQGTILASDVLALTGLALGYEVKKSETHGMSQRGGSVDSHVRWGSEVHSPLAEIGTVDYIISFEVLETARWVNYLRPGGTILINEHRIRPLMVGLGEAQYPSDEALLEAFRARADRVYLLPCLAAAQELGNVRTMNVVLLGALSELMGMEPDPWLQVIEQRVPARFVELNRRAFARGRELAQS